MQRKQARICASGRRVVPAVALWPDAGSRVYKSKPPSTVDTSSPARQVSGWRCGGSRPVELPHSCSEGVARAREVPEWDVDGLGP